jgi:adenine phosphoribosyltransferase
MTMELEAYIRDIRDFPVPGIVFRDLTPLLGDPAALAESVRRLAAPYRSMGVRAVAGIEARGFVFGSLVARELGAGFVPLRKPGKLPARVESASYTLEYGTATLEIHADAFVAGTPVLLIDDVLATGGTAAAALDLLQRLDAHVVGAGFVIELEALGGRARLDGHRVTSVVVL